jgi:hypothetical protein
LAVVFDPANRFVSPRLFVYDPLKTDRLEKHHRDAMKPYFSSSDIESAVMLKKHASVIQNDLVHCGYHSVAMAACLSDLTASSNVVPSNFNCVQWVGVSGAQLNELLRKDVWQILKCGTTPKYLVFVPEASTAPVCFLILLLSF